MSLPSLPPPSGGGSKVPPARAGLATHPLQIDLSTMSVEDRLDLRTQIDESLPVKSLKDLDLNQELVLQLLQVQKLQRDVFQGDETPANQMAQVANSVASVIGQLVSLQAKVYSSERFELVESVLIDTINEMPAKLAKEFFDRYQRAGLDRDV